MLRDYRLIGSSRKKLLTRSSNLMCGWRDVPQLSYTFDENQIPMKVHFIAIGGSVMHNLAIALIKKDIRSPDQTMRSLNHRKAGS